MLDCVLIKYWMFFDQMIHVFGQMLNEIVFDQMLKVCLINVKIVVWPNIKCCFIA